MLAATLLALTVVAASGISATSRSVVSATITANGRGAYDLLVTSGSALSANAAQHEGLLEQNFTALTGSGLITVDQLARIRRIAGVGVAAPLSFVGNLTSPGYGVLIGARDPRGARAGFFTATPRAFEVTAQIMTSNGVQTQTLASTRSVMVVARTGTGPQAAALLAATNVTSENTEDLSADVTIPGVPELSAGLVAVDPVAEQHLLGAGGTVVKPLDEFDATVARGGTGASLASLIPSRYAIERDALTQSAPGKQVLPVIVSNTSYAALSARVVFRRIGLASVRPAQLFTSTSGGVTQLTPAGSTLLSHAARGPAITVVRDLTRHVVPFAEPYFSIPLPGATSGPAGAADTSSPVLLPTLVAPAAYSRVLPGAGAPSGMGEALRATPAGRVQLTPTASEQTYRPHGRFVRGRTKDFVYAPLGTYTPGDITGTAQTAAYVPLGTYSSGSATVLSSTTPVTLGPSFSGRGLELPAPAAITSLAALRAIRPGAGVDVVRVRVTGDHDYTPEVKQRIEAVASRIVAMGLSVRVVAGSSLTPVAVYVPRFFAQPNGDHGADLGWVRQEWTSLGAAVIVQSATSTSGRWLFAISLFAAVLLAGAVQALSLGGSRTESELLRQLGWSRRRILGWFLVEGSLPVLIVLIGAAVALLFNADNPFSVAASGVGVGIASAFAIGGALLASRRRPLSHARSTSKQNRRAAHTPTAIGGRMAAGEPAAVAMMAGALAVIAVTAVGFIVTVRSGSRRSGLSRLADLVGQQAKFAQVALAVLALVAAAVLFTIGAADLQRRAAAQIAMLRHSGWTTAETATLTRGMTAVPYGIGLVLGTVLSTVVAVAADRHTWWPSELIAVSAMLVVLALVLSVARLIAIAHTRARRTRRA